VLKAQAILEKDYGVAADVWSVTKLQGTLSRRERLRAVEHAASDAGSESAVRYEDAQGRIGPFIAASDYMKVLPESIAQWIPGKLVSLGTDGFGRSENRASLRDFFEVGRQAYCARHAARAGWGKIRRQEGRRRSCECESAGRERFAISASIRRNAIRQTS